MIWLALALIAFAAVAGCLLHRRANRDRTLAQGRTLDAMAANVGLTRRRFERDAKLRTRIASAVWTPLREHQ